MGAATFSVHGLRRWDCWPWHRQRNPGSNIGFGHFAYIPLAQAETLTALDQIEMDVRFMIAVGSRPKYGCKPMASTIAQILAEVLCDRNIREAKGTAICQDECPQVDRVLTLPCSLTFAPTIRLRSRHSKS